MIFRFSTGKVKLTTWGSPETISATGIVGEECDINPLIASEESILALDARVLLYDVAIDDMDLPQPSIRPYPHQPLGSCIFTQAFGDVSGCFRMFQLGFSTIFFRCEGSLGIQINLD